MTDDEDHGQTLSHSGLTCLFFLFCLSGMDLTPSRLIYHQRMRRKGAEFGGESSLYASDRLKEKPCRTTIVTSANQEKSN